MCRPVLLEQSFIVAVYSSSKLLTNFELSNSSVGIDVVHRELIVVAVIKLE